MQNEFGFIKKHKNLISRVGDTIYNLINNYNNETLYVDYEDLKIAFIQNVEEWKNNPEMVDVDEFSANYVFSKYKDHTAEQKEMLYAQAKEFLKSEH